MSARAQILFLGILATGALVAAAFTVHIGADRLQQARGEWALANKNLAQAEELLSRAKVSKRLEIAAAALVAKSAGMHLDPEQWVEQKVNLNQATLARNQVDSLLRETALTPRQVFDVEDFDIAVTSPEDGLFDVPANSTTQDLRLTLRGTVLTRAGGKP